MNQYFIDALADVQADVIGENTRIRQFVVVLAGAKIGKDCKICSHCLIENYVIIGDRITVKSGVQLWDGLRVGDDVFIGPNATFTNDKFPRSKAYPTHYSPTFLMSGASIGGGGGDPARHNNWRQGHGWSRSRRYQVGAGRGDRRRQSSAPCWVRGGQS
jgi:NDP-sugar pyrophosphorylase family protein